jgi:hypothetical protein
MSFPLVACPVYSFHEVISMRARLLFVIAMAVFALSLAAQADEHVRVIYGQKGNALIVFGGGKTRDGGGKATFAFLSNTSPVDCEALNRWLTRTYVEWGTYAGFADCPMDCSGDDRIPTRIPGWLGAYADLMVPNLTASVWGAFSSWISWPHALAVASAARSLDPRYEPDEWATSPHPLPSIQSTYWGVRTALAAGGSFNTFVYDKFAAFARSVLVDPSAAVEDSIAACRILNLVTGLTQDDRLLLCARADAAFAAVGDAAHAVAPLLDEASLSPSAGLRSALQKRADVLVPAITAEPTAAALLELARLQRLLGVDAGVSSDQILEAAIFLVSESGGFRADPGSTAPDLFSTLCVLEALALVDRIMEVNADPVRAYILSCWISPGFAAVRPGDVVPIASVACTDLHATYVGTEALAILENRDVP